MHDGSVGTTERLEDDMAIAKYDSNRGVIYLATAATFVEKLTATRTIAGHAKDVEDLIDIMDVLGISKQELMLAMLEVETDLRL
jgi:hypothetical protein